MDRFYNIILGDLAAYQDGRLIPLDLLEYFSCLVYRELLVQETLHVLTELKGKEMLVN